MAILRKDNKERYTTVPALILRDDRLSLRDVGLLVCMLGLPDNWKFSEKGLEAVFRNDGITSIRSGLKKLEETGYLVRKRTRGADGKVGVVEWHIFDKPQSEKPRLDFPSVDKPSVENQTQYNTKQSNTKESKTKVYIYPFEEFWKAYPKKKAKEAARKAWDKLKPDEALGKAIIKAVMNECNSKDWKKDGGKYIPYPATYLNGKRWEDEGTTYGYNDAHNSDEDLGDLIYGR